MRIGVIGAGGIGANVARLWAAAGHEVMVSFARDRQRLESLAKEINGVAGSPEEAAGFGEAVLLSVPWLVVPDAVEQAGSLDGRIVLDTTNPFDKGELIDLPDGRTAGQVNTERVPGARLVRGFSTLTAGFLAKEAGREAADRVVIFYCGDEPVAKDVAAGLIRDAGFYAADLGDLVAGGAMDAPRRDSSVFGEEYRPGDVPPVVEAVRAGKSLPAAPGY